MRLNSLAGQVYTVAVNEAKLNLHEYIMPEHFLYSVLMFEAGREIISNSGGSVSGINQDLADFFADHVIKTHGDSPRESAAFVAMFERLQLRHCHYRLWHIAQYFSISIVS